MKIIIFLILIFLYFRNKGIPAVLYHQINSSSNVDKDLFEKHIKYLSDNGYKGITISDYINKSFDKYDKNIMITFDDGYYDNYANAFPILKKYNMKATIFLNTFFIKDEKRKEITEIKESRVANYEAIKNYNLTGDASSWQYMTWEEIKEMEESGIIDFQAHSHKHAPIFSDLSLKGFYEEKSTDSSDLYLYGNEIEMGTPIFSKRGECSTKGYKINEEFFKVFSKFYQENKEKDNLINLSQEFVKSRIGVDIIEESLEEAEKRIFEEGLKNKEIIEGKLNKEVSSFCWPWGHKSELGIKALEKAGYKSFVTTKKGTNSIWGNNLKIRRIELRNFTLKKFILNIKINRNLILGRLYELIS